MAHANPLVKGRYVLLGDPVRTGGTADVFRARNIESDEVVAIKLFRADGHPNRFVREFFLRESESLEELRHPNIVSLIEAMYDPDRSEHFLALEWVPHTLSSWLAQHPPAGWDDLADQVATPLLEAIVFAHGRRILHRDIKPSNVLIASDGTPKLADFGIAKLLTSLRLGVTLSSFRSEPYSPPEQRDEIFDERGDLFAFGVTLVKCLVPDAYDLTHASLQDAVSIADVPPAAEAFLRRLVALDPDTRFDSSTLALGEFALLKRSRPAPPPLPRPKIHMKLTQAATQALNSRIERGGGSVAVHEFVRRDVGDECAIEYLRSTVGKVEDESFRLVGNEFYYVLRVDWSDPAVLAITGAYEAPPSLLDEQRDRAMPVRVEPVFTSPVFPDQARAVVTALRERLLEHEQQRRLHREEAAKRGLLDRWSDILDAKLRIERQRQSPLPYDGREINGREVTFRLEDPIAAGPDQAEFFTQIRRVAVPGGWIGGPVVDVFQDRMVVSITSGEPHQIPKAGRLQVDRDMSERAIRRQRSALDDLRFGRGARPDLASLLVDPSVARQPHFSTDLDFITPNLDEPKRKAVSAAMGSLDLITVEGPPGTGKTTFIAELICQLRRRRPSDRLLLTAQTHVAVDNAVERMRELDPSLRLVRVGSPAKIGPGALEHTVEAGLRRWSDDVRRIAPQFFLKWAAERGLEPAVLTQVSAIGDLEDSQRFLEGTIAEIAKLEALEEAFADRLTDPKGPGTTSPELAIRESGLDFLSTTTVDVDISLEDAHASVVERLAQRRQEFKEHESLRDKRVVDLCAGLGVDTQAADADRLLEIIRSKTPNVDAITEYRRLRDIQDDWLARFGSAEFEAALLSESDVVAGTCVGIAAVRAADSLTFDVVIIDEASKAAPTEALVPMVRGRSWVLVGDPRQLPPFVDASLLKTSLLAEAGVDPEELRQTVFDRLLEGLPASNRVGLTVQHRMVAAIGELVSECFYRGQLVSSRPSPTIQALVRVSDHPVVWWSTSRLDNRLEQRRGLSYANPEEAKRIREWLAFLHLHARGTKETVTVAVISGYAEQRELLARELGPHQSGWLPHVEVTIDSVDSFQGQERDAVVYSVTRSNRDGSLGFLSSIERLNVALSRGRDALVIFGDSAFCEASARSENPFISVLEYIRKHPDTCRLEMCQ